MPHLYRTGADEAGRSTIAERRPLVRGAKPETVLQLEDTAVPIDEGSADVVLLESPSPVGGAAYNVYTWRAGQRTPMHRTSTVDVDVVLQGSIELETETETVVLHAGDVVIVGGHAHAWHSSDEGGIVLFGLLTGSATGADVELPRSPFG